MKYSIVQNDGKKEVQHNGMPERVMYACCPLCESSNIGELTIGDCSKHPLYNPKINPKMHWKKCSDCLHVFTNGFFTEEICEIVFGSSHKNQVVGNQIEQSRAVSARMIEKVLPFASEGIWLDVGFGNASLLFTAQEFGFTPVGIDLRKENVHALRALNVESHCVDLSELKLNEACSVISMADVLEHMPFPKDGLVSANKLLAKGGVLLVSMPNTENIVWSSLTASNSNPYWGELEHYHNFSRTRLYQLLDEHGFKVMRYGISERYRVCMEVVAVKIREIHKDLVGSGKN
jgi:SAM-dependent methyltransferase